MRKVLAIVAAAAAALAIAGAPASAADSLFGPFKIGPEVGLGTGNGDEYAGDAAFGLGVRGEYSLQELVELPISVAASFDYFFVDCPAGVDCTLFEINANGLYTLPLSIPEMVSVYAGGGLNLAYAKVKRFGHSASNSDLGLNLLCGVKFNLDLMFTPFVETKFEAAGGDQFVITGGVLF